MPRNRDTGDWVCDTPGCGHTVTEGTGNFCRICTNPRPRTRPVVETGICSVCSALVDADQTICEYCEDETTVCEGCSTRVNNDDITTTPRDTMLCPSCFEDNWFVCRDCGDIYDMNHCYSSRRGDSYCCDCYDERYRTCDNCGEEVTRDNIYYDDNSDGWYCNTCHRESNALHEYHCGFNVYFHPPIRSGEGAMPLYLGVELETDKYNDRGQAADDLVTLSEDGNLFHMEEDGSLECGIEIISQPCTLDYHRTKFPWEVISAMVQRHGGLSHQTTTCGLHIHFNKAFFGDMLNINSLKLMYLFERFWDKFVIFSRRRGDGWMHYAAKYNDDFEHCETEDQVNYKLLESRDKGRYFAVNITHTKTIEIRIFKGTLRTGTILASLELVDFLARYVKDNSIQQLQQTTWDTLVASIGTDYVNLNAYLVSKHLKGE